MRRIVIFGQGIYWKKRKKFILGKHAVVCILDNACGVSYCTGEHIQVANPNKIHDYEYDLILLMSKYKEEMRNQLLELQVEENKIWNWEKFVLEECREQYVYYGKTSDGVNTLICTTAMDYNGGTIAAIYAAKALMQGHRHVIICTENCEEKLLNELIKEDISVLIVPTMPVYINNKVQELIDKCQIVFANTLQMKDFVGKINGTKPILWWLHEPKSFYEPILNQYNEYQGKAFFDKINIKAVSNIAQEGFNQHFGNVVTSILLYGIPDQYIEKNIPKQTNKIVFAIIGSLSVIKAQDIFIEAVKLLTQEDREKAVFYMIGQEFNNAYSSEIKRAADKFPQIRITGQLTREQMDEIYSEIDVVVCPSREETMSLVLTEAMMYKKACISSDKTGMADYITDGSNGMLFETENPIELCNKMKLFIHNPQRIARVGENGRKTYLKYFTMDIFGKHINDAIIETIETYK